MTGSAGVAALMAVRHGQSAANAAFAHAERHDVAESGITCPDAEVPLTLLGQAQSAALGRWLAGLPPAEYPQLIYCSPFRRARQTLRVIGDQAGAAGLTLPAAIVDARLRDREMGELELLTSTAIRRRFPHEYARRARVGELDYRPPGGESLLDVGERLRSLYGEVAAAHADRRIMVVGHDSVVLMLRYLVEELSRDALAGLIAAGPVRNASVTRWVREGGHLRLCAYDLVPDEVSGGEAAADGA